MTFNTPAGTPQAKAISARMSVLTGVSGEGLSTIEQPAASAGATFQVAAASGKFHGVIAATTPMGCLMTRLRDSTGTNSASSVSATKPSMRSA